MGIAPLRLDSTATVTLSATMVIPVLNTVPTITGFVQNAGPAASLVTLSDLKTFFEGGTADEFVSTTAISDPATYAATTFSGYATTVDGAVVRGYGSTSDVALKNRVGTVAFYVTQNSTGVVAVGTLAVGGVTTFQAPLASSIAQVAAVGTTPGTAGTDTTLTMGQGGNTTIVTTGVGGKGAGWTVTTGAGGTAALAATAGTGGAGGDYALTTGAGAVSAVTGAGTGTGGKGGAFAILTGVGGAVTTSTGANVGGASGAVTLTTAAGGASSNGSANTGGASGVITFSTGNGGAGATAQGNSGAITFQTGSSTATVGTIVLKPGGLQVLSANWVSALVGQVVVDGTYGAGVASLRLNGLTTATTNNLVGTLTNSPVTGNPTFWAPVSIAGVIKYIPCF